MQAGATALAVLALVAASAGCGPRAIKGASTSAAAPASGEQGYRSAPELLSARPNGPGLIELAGRASPGAAVRLAAPSGAERFAKTDGHGLWRVEIKASPQPRLFSLSMSDKGRLVQAMGYLFVAPDAAVTRLRAGGGSETPTQGAKALQTLTIDYDDKQAATISGLAGPNETVSLRVDGVERGRGRADGKGRFVLPLDAPLPAGLHAFDLTSPETEVRFSAAIDTPAPLAGAPFAATPLPQGWRIDWITPGGGEQTTLVLSGLGASG